MARLFALLSAWSSFGYLAGLAVGIVLLFFNWKLALIVLAGALILAPAAKMFDGMKLRAIYGHDAGRIFADKDWATGKRNATIIAAIDRAAWDAKLDEK